MYHYLTWIYIFITITAVHSFTNHTRLEFHAKLSWLTLTAQSHTTDWIHTRTSLPRHWAGFLSLPRPLRQQYGIKNQTLYDCSVQQRSVGMAIGQVSYLRYVRMSTGKGQVLGDHITASWVWVSACMDKLHLKEHINILRGVHYRIF